MVRNRYTRDEIIEVLDELRTGNIDRGWPFLEDHMTDAIYYVHKSRSSTGPEDVEC